MNVAPALSSSSSSDSEESKAEQARVHQDRHQQTLQAWLLSLGWEPNDGFQEIYPVTTSQYVSSFINSFAFSIFQFISQSVLLQRREELPWVILFLIVSHGFENLPDGEITDGIFGLLIDGLLRQ